MVELLRALIAHSLTFISRCTVQGYLRAASSMARVHCRAVTTCLHWNARKRTVNAVLSASSAALILFCALALPRQNVNFEPFGHWVRSASVVRP